MEVSTYSKIRSLWHNYWKRQNYFFIESKSIISEDKSLLFINSGISAIKKYFLEQKDLPSSYLYNLQACLRLNDLINIGITNRHNSFFEMLGHYSIGICSKEKAIFQAINFLCGKNWLNFDKKRIYVTVYEKDIESFLIWQKYISKNHIMQNKSDKNFWKIGKGPCGPNTEIYYKLKNSKSKITSSNNLLCEDIENENFLELWNIVFSEFNYLGKGKYNNLLHKSVDVGAGLERILVVYETKNNIFETTLFHPLVEKIKKISNSKVKKRNQQYYRICDFLRSIVFLMANKVQPTNKTHGSVLKKIIRLLLLEMIKEQLSLTVFKIGFKYFIDHYSNYYPELNKIDNLVKQPIFDFANTQLIKFHNWWSVYLAFLKHTNQRSTKYQNLFANAVIYEYFFNNVRDLLYPSERFKKYTTFGSWQPEFQKQYKEILDFLNIKFYFSYNYSILMPPPNITGVLHLGHLYELFIQDTLFREKKLTGFNPIWFAGYDHGGISTQIKINNFIHNKNHGSNKNIYLNFSNYANEWTTQIKKNILDQWRKCGLLIDTNAVNYTLDKNSIDTANFVFSLLHDKKYIYRSDRIVNYDPVLKTVISDVEVGKRIQIGYLYYVKYRLSGSKKNYIVATSRPETIFADEYIAINAQDARVPELRNKCLINPLTGEKLPVIIDKIVDLKFGSGLVKITPGHDFNDFEIGKKYEKTKFLQIINRSGLMMNVQTPFNDLHYMKCREMVVKQLTRTNQLLKRKEYSGTVNFNLKNNVNVVPLLSSQWFLALNKISVKFLKKFTVKSILKLPINFLPKKTNGVVEKFLRNTKDWCISRQIKWGHKIPIAFKSGTNNMEYICTVDKQYSSSNYIQGTDVFDTWFTSCLWPLISAKFEKDIDFFAKNYPISILTTGYDILFIWVIRMILLCFVVADLLNKTNKNQIKIPLVPFQTVHIHGLIRDKNNIKMAKSNNNGVDPLEVIMDYGNDAMRLFFLLEHKQMHDIKFVALKIHEWNAYLLKINSIAKFLQKYHHLKETQKFKTADKEPLIINYFFTEFKEFICDLHRNEYKFLIAEKRIINHNKYKNIIQFITKNFSGFMIEQAKFYLSDPRCKCSSQQKDQILDVVVWIFSELLILIHPVCPFITEYWFRKFNLKSIYKFKSILYPTRFYDLVFNKYKKFITNKIISREWKLLKIKDSLNNSENQCIISSLRKNLPHLEQYIVYNCNSPQAINLEIKNLFTSILYVKKILPKFIESKIFSKWINYSEWTSIQKISFLFLRRTTIKKNIGFYCEFELLIPKGKTDLIMRDIQLATKKLTIEKEFLENKIEKLRKNSKLIKSVIDQKKIHEKIRTFCEKKQIIIKTLSAINENMLKQRS